MALKSSALGTAHVLSTLEKPLLWLTFSRAWTKTKALLSSLSLGLNAHIWFSNALGLLDRPTDLYNASCFYIRCCTSLKLEIRWIGFPRGDSAHQPTSTSAWTPNNSRLISWPIFSSSYSIIAQKVTFVCWTDCTFCWNVSCSMDGHPKSQCFRA